MLDRSALHPAERSLLRTLHQTIDKITHDFDGRWHFNTSISAIMIFVNELTTADTAMQKDEISPAAVASLLDSLVLLLAPFAPYLAAELWERLGHTDSVLRHPWPVFDPELARADQREIPVQVNGKLKAVVTMPADATREEMEHLILSDEKVRAAIAGKAMIKLIVVPDKLLNILVK
jgi:leucyl-tRNA synthetase